MARGKEHTAEQIVNLLRHEVCVANGKTLPQACKEAKLVEQTYYRWRKECGGLKVDQARRLKDLAGEREAEAVGIGVEPGEAGVEGHRLGKLLSPERRRCAVSHAQQAHGMSERQACRVVKQPRGTQRYQPTQRDDEDTLT